MISTVLTLAAILTCGYIPLTPGLATAAPQSAADAQTEALSAFQRGHVEQAIILWRRAAQRYAQQPQPLARVLTHLAHAYLSIGDVDKATQHLREALQRAQEAGDRSQIALILGDLGHVQATLGKGQEANRLLSDAIARAHEFGDIALTATLLYTRGHVFMMQQETHEAIAAYRNSAELALQVQRHDIAARALVQAAVVAEREKQPAVAATLLDTALTSLQHVPASSETAAEWVALGRAYHQLSAAQPALIRRAAEAYGKAADIAQGLRDQRHLSYAWGYLGRLYEGQSRFTEALTLTRRAALAAQSIPESLYLWQWQSGRLLAAMERAAPALQAYERALQTVQPIRAALLRRLRSEHHTFRQTLGPMYFEYASLLLQQTDALQPHGHTAARTTYEGYLRRARDAMEQFKTQELREYFGDECVDVASENPVWVDDVSRGHSSDLPDSLAGSDRIAGEYCRGAQTHCVIRARSEN